ncbi:MAG: hypothetical protein JXQ79_03180 [Rhodobacteraceae bacterium]|nr:hypothetical protein [Paracoccaceae bacterium]
MPSLDETIDALIARAERDKGAAYHLSRLRAFLGSEVERGVMVDVDVAEIALGHPVGQISVTITADAFGDICAPVEEVAAMPATSPENLPPDPLCPAAQTEPKPEAHSAKLSPRAMRKIKRGTPWTAEEDALVLQMDAEGAKIADIAKAVNRTIDATKSRLKNFLRKQSAPEGAKRAPRDDLRENPATKEPAAPTVVRPAVQKLVAPSPDAPNFSPLAAIEVEEVNDKIMVEHLHWFYQSKNPDPDIVACDLELVEGLARGDAAADVAERLGWAKADVIERFKALRCDHTCTLKLQMSLLVCLRRLAGSLAA